MPHNVHYTGHAHNTYSHIVRSTCGVDNYYMYMYGAGDVKLRHHVQALNVGTSE